MTDIQYGIKIMGGREVSRPYRFFSPKASGFYPLGKVDSPRKRVAEGLCGGAAWKLVSNDARRTVASPNAKHSTLPQGCFLCFCL